MVQNPIRSGNYNITPLAGWKSAFSVLVNLFSLEVLSISESFAIINPSLKVNVFFQLCADHGDLIVLDVTFLLHDSEEGRHNGRDRLQFHRSLN
ncbi:hypothetical protein F2Q70_00007096 [Brassica cretica]|uniref:Uncharacterized protein n=1 Tax=Brassica cretica TaxID=69181 RepID=A0A8S9MA71_BRACR|nr:hypothetical protein F2Q70_00007096 [Brassica cretica]